MVKKNLGIWWRAGVTSVGVGWQESKAVEWSRTWLLVLDSLRWVSYEVIPFEREHFERSHDLAWSRGAPVTSQPVARVVFSRLFERLPIRILTSELYHQTWCQWWKKSVWSEIVVLECSCPLLLQSYFFFLHFPIIFFFSFFFSKLLTYWFIIKPFLLLSFSHKKILCGIHHKQTGDPYQRGEKSFSHGQMCPFTTFFNSAEHKDPQARHIWNIFHIHPVSCSSHTLDL